MKFFVWLNDQEQGPFDEETIQKMVADGQITQETLLRTEDGDLDWTAAKDLFPQDSIPESLATLNSPPVLVDDSRVEVRVHRYQTFAYAAPKSNDNSLVGIRLNSGIELKIKAVRLYDRYTLSAINSKKAEARQKHQGVSTGLGAIGSIGWVLATTAVIGAVEGALSAHAAAQGSDLLTDAIRMELDLRNRGAFLPVGTIKNIEHPFPEIWLVLGESTYVVDGKAQKFSSSFIHNGDEFIVVQADNDSICSIRWSSVEHYAYLPNAQ